MPKVVIRGYNVGIAFFMSSFYCLLLFDVFSQNLIGILISQNAGNPCCVSSRLPIGIPSP